MTARNLNIDGQRLLSRLKALGEIGALEGGGVCRLALSDEDRLARDLVTSWMRELGLEVRIDRLGNIVGTRPGVEDGPPVMMGSHIDTVRTGGLYDGSLGVLAGLEVVETLNDAGIATRRPIAVAAFTNEEGARFAPDMMGSLVFEGSMSVEEAHAVTAVDDGTTVGENLARIGYEGVAPCGAPALHAFLELHIEQGPVLDEEGLVIGAVEGVQGISWTEVRVAGVSNHAGTTPMRLRHDAGYVAGATIGFVRELASLIGGDQVATVGRIELYPNLVNVVPGSCTFTVDLRNSDEECLREAEQRLHAFLDDLATREGVEITRHALARFVPTRFDEDMVRLIERSAAALGHSARRLSSGAGHDAQIIARACPAAMIFVPSHRGISHNIDEHTEPDHLVAGANVLLGTLLDLAD